MKFVIYVCACVVLFACNEVMSSHFPARLSGDCQPEDLPPRALAGCDNIRCNRDENGQLSLSGTTCGLIGCPNGWYMTRGEPDLTKKFPDCCFVPECKEL